MDQCDRMSEFPDNSEYTVGGSDANATSQNADRDTDMTHSAFI